MWGKYPPLWEGDRHRDRDRDKEREPEIYVFLHSAQNSNLLLTKYQEECDGDTDAISSAFGQVNRILHRQTSESLKTKWQTCSNDDCLYGHHVPTYLTSLPCRKRCRDLNVTTCIWSFQTGCFFFQLENRICSHEVSQEVNAAFVSSDSNRSSLSDLYLKSVFSPKTPITEKRKGSWGCVKEHGG